MSTPITAGVPPSYSPAGKESEQGRSDKVVTTRHGRRYTFAAQTALSELRNQYEERVDKEAARIVKDAAESVTDATITEAADRIRFDGDKLKAHWLPAAHAERVLTIGKFVALLSESASQRMAHEDAGAVSRSHVRRAYDSMRPLTGAERDEIERSRREERREIDRLSWYRSVGASTAVAGIVHMMVASEGDPNLGHLIVIVLGFGIGLWAFLRAQSV